MNEPLSIDLNYIQSAVAEPPESVESFMDAAVQLGSEFLACGGPVTRLEAQISAAGGQVGFETTVHATPSAITVYCHISDERQSYSRGGRIQSFGVDLGRLSLTDKMLNQFSQGLIPSREVVGWLEASAQGAMAPHPILHFLSLFGLGAGAAFLGGGNLAQVAGCGLFTVLVQLLIATLGKFVTLTSIFVEFLSCFAAFFFAVVTKDALGVPAPLLALGTLIYVVPGLLLTTAISEVVDQNYLSGSIRLLKALCTFMAMALAYFLAQDIARAMAINLDDILFVSAGQPGFSARILGSAIIIVCSAMEFRAHWKSLPGILACGLLGAVCCSVTQSPKNLVAPHFFGAFIIGFVSYILSRRYKHPSQIYSVPSVLILAPGMLAFASFGYGHYEDFNLPSILRAALISLSIVFGLAAGRLPFRSSQTCLDR